MPTLHVVPIESIEDRYSAQWNQWWPRELRKMNLPFVWYYLTGFDGSIKRGEFLDVTRTNEFKAWQLHQLCRNISWGKIVDGDIILFHDLWFPGLESLFYIRDGMKLDIRIAGLLHAGTYDPYDFLTRSGMRPWASLIEEAWFGAVDDIFVATEYHRNLLVATRIGSINKVHVTGFPLRRGHWSDQGYPLRANKENIVVFPHRLAPEKGPDEFDLLTDRLAPSFPEWKFIRSKDVCKTKDEYYALLAKSKIAVSCAYQETWGIAQQEATILGCIPVVPDRLSYREMYPGRYRYRSLGEAEEMIRFHCLNGVDLSSDPSLRALANKFLSKGEAAIPNIVAKLGFPEWTPSRLNEFLTMQPAVKDS